MDNILGIDPALHNTGWAIITESDQYVASGIITTNVKSDVCTRLAHIWQQIDQLLAAYPCAVCSMEEVFVNSNPHSSLSLGYARGVILGAMGQRGLTCMHLAPASVKKLVTGKGNATKEDVHRALQLWFPAFAPALHDESDALAVAFAANLQRKWARVAGQL